MIDLPAEISTMALALPAGPKGAPKKRLSDPNKATEIVDLLIYANQDRSKLDSRVRGMLDGNSPFNYEELRRQGQSNRTNVNFREGEAILNAAITPYYDLFAEADTYAKVTIDDPDPSKAADYSRIATNEFDDLLKSWSGFDWNMQAMILDMVAFGRGFVMWPNATNWQFRAMKQSRVLVPDGTASDLDQLEILVVRQTYMVHELYGCIQDPEAASQIGWNVSQVMEAIGRAAPEKSSDNARMDYDLMQQELRNHDLYQTVKSHVVRCAHIFVKEFNGKVSQMIIEERMRNKEGKIPDQGFLYQKIGRYESFRQVIGTVFYDIGDGTWHSIKGLAVKLYPFIEIKNRLNCAIVDNAFINMSVLVRPTSERGEQAMAIIQLGPLSILPPNLEVTQWGIAGRMEEGLTVEQSLSNRLESNIGQYRKPMTREKGNPATARQVTFDAAKEASLSKGSVNRFYGQCDLIFAEQYRRAVDFNLDDDAGGPNSRAKEFQERCIAAGIPKKALMRPKSVKATRNMGNGSVFMRQEAIMSTMGLVPMLNEAGRQNWLDAAIGVLTGSDNVSRFNPRSTTTPTISNEMAYATIENAVLAQGSPVQWTGTQNNSVHAMVHLKAATDAANSLQQGGDPSHVLTFLEAMGAHIAVHLDELKKDPNKKQEVEALGAQLAQLGQIVDSLTKQMQQAMQEQQQQAQKQQQVMDDQQLAQVETASKIKMQQEKTDAALAMKQEKHNQSLALADAQTAEKIRADRAMAEAKAEEMRKKAATKPKA